MAIFDKYTRDANENSKHTRFFTAEGESLAILLAFVTIGYWFNPADPLFVHSEFPWLIFASLLPALRYGFVYGFTSALLLIGLLAAAARWQWLGVDTFPVKYSIGLLFSAMLAGEFVDLWMKREARQRIVNSYQHMRLEEFTRSYHLLKVSHDRMEHRLAAGTVSLREALMGMRRRLLLHSGDDVLGSDAGRQILQLFADYVSIRVAAIYRVDKAKKVVPDPVAVLGQGDTDPNHEMVIQAVREGCIVSVRDVLDRRGELANGPLAAVPLIDVNGRTHGILVIEDMLFLSLQEENLRLLAVLGGQIGDMLALAASHTGTDADSARFVRETQRAVLNRRLYGLSAMVVNIALPPGDAGEEIKGLLVRQRRGLDCIWVRENGGARSVWLLMPLTGPVEYEGYRKRIVRFLRERFGQSMEEIGIRITVQEIKPKDTIDRLLEGDEQQGQ
jgi:hypothetical protein